MQRRGREWGLERRATSPLAERCGSIVPRKGSDDGTEGRAPRTPMCAGTRTGARVPERVGGVVTADRGRHRCGRSRRSRRRPLPRRRCREDRRRGRRGARRVGPALTGWRSAGRADGGPRAARGVVRDVEEAAAPSTRPLQHPGARSHAEDRGSGDNHRPATF